MWQRNSREWSMARSHALTLKLCHLPIAVWAVCYDGTPAASELCSRTNRASSCHHVQVEMAKCSIAKHSPIQGVANHVCTTKPLHACAEFTFQMRCCRRWAVMYQPGDREPPCGCNNVRPQRLQ